MPSDRMNLPPTSVMTSTYRSYVVRFWRSNPSSPLRASAQCIQTGAVLHFATLASLFEFLESLDTPLDAAEPTDPPPADQG